MKEKKGKIFNEQEVQAIIAGKKTMFREVVKKTKNEIENYSLPAECGTELLLSEAPYKVGQEIFVKEAFWQFGGYNSGYDCDEPKFIGSNKITLSKEEVTEPQTLNKAWKKRPAQHMKQEHSRLMLKITKVKVERLADISEEDAIKEGATSRPNCRGYGNIYDGWSMDWSRVGQLSKYTLSGTGKLTESDISMGCAKYAFANHWNSTHKKPEEKWDANPWVFVYEFEVINN